jgi:hypothetical protein
MVDPLTTLGAVVGGQIRRQAGSEPEDLVVARARAVSDRS